MAGDPVKRALLAFAILIGCASFIFQSGVPFVGSTWNGGASAITQEATCTGNGTANYLACSSAMTVTAGDIITCNMTGVSPGQTLTGTVVDPTNGFYDNVFGMVHPASTTSWVTTATFQNSAGGSITPQIYYNNPPSTRATISCYAWKGVRTSFALDGGAVNQTTSATVTNPTSGTAASPTNNNEAVVAYMSRSSSTAPSSGTGWSPAGTLTLVGSSSVRQASEYQIQTTAASVNGAFTGNGSSIATVDSQLAVINASSPAGYRALTGFHLPLGTAGSAPTGTVTAGALGGATSFLNSTNTNTAWAQSGATAATYDTGVNPTGTGKIMVQGVTHTFGDAGSSVLFAGATPTNNYYEWIDNFGSQGAPIWVSLFYRANTGEVSGNICDVVTVNGGVSTTNLAFQTQYTTALGLHAILEPFENGSSPTFSWSGTLGTDYWFQIHVAGANERYHQLRVSAKSGGVWGQVGSFNYDVLCEGTNTHNLCSSPTTAATPTGTASSGSTALTISSGTGTANGQVVLDPTNNCIPYPTLVEAGGTTTSITLSQNTTCSISGTTVNFYPVPPNLKVATNCSVTAGSTSMSCVAPGVGTITAGYAVGATGIIQGVLVSAVSGSGPITVTLSSPATSTLTNAGVSFWYNGGNADYVVFGKYSSCNFTVNQWFSAITYDPFGTWGAFDPN